MRAAQASRTARRAKELGLNIDTNIPPAGTSAPPNPDAPIFAQIASAPAHKVHFENVKDRTSKSRMSEALANSDWRNNRPDATRSRGAPLVPPSTAGPEKTEFQAAGGVPIKTLTIDTSMTGPRHYRGTPVDPDFIHSAPLTKTDYKVAEDKSESYDIARSLDPHYETKLQTQPPTTKPIIELGPLAPATHQKIDRWCDLNLTVTKKGNDGFEDKWSYRNIPLKAIPVSHSRDSTSTDDDISFPAAAVKAIKSSKRFYAAGWDSLDKEVQKNLSKLEAPRTAGLPPDHLRAEYDRGQHAIATKAVMTDPAVQSMEAGGRYHSSVLASKPELKKAEEEQKRFDALISKLQKRSSSHVSNLSIRSQPFSWPDTSDESEKPENVAPQRASPANDSGISGVDVKHEKNKSTTLNPLASEFRSSSGLNNKNATALVKYPLDRSENLPPKTTFDSGSLPNGSNGGDTRSATVGDVQEIFAYMNELRTEIAQLKAAAASQQSSNKAEQNLMQQLSNIETMVTELNLNQRSFGLPQAPQGPPPLSLAPGNVTWPGVQPHGYIPTQPQLSSPNAGPQFNRPAPYHQHNAFNAPQAPPFPMAPPQAGITQAPGIPMAGSLAITGPNDFSHLPLHKQAQIAFGPKPVRKPKAPSHPGDQRYAQQQLAYEEYLELRRANDPNFALQCRQRQARRAEKQLGRFHGTSKKGPDGNSQGPQAPAPGT
ncbi:hypothetical protein F5Y04DRAFT_288599 [Hypomontagnella monticulosa]|nr:hypothetical protein F5Y04DRAFT_288599 [Hypomontagnella monticulosa]